MSRAKHRARERAAQAIYQWQLTSDPVSDIQAQFLTDEDSGDMDREFFGELLRGVVEHRQELDSCLTPHLDRLLESVDPVERALLRLGAYELKYRLETPYRVVINEAVELAKTFGAEQAHRYINGILDKVARDLRQPEVKARSGS